MLSNPHLDAHGALGFAGTNPFAAVPAFTVRDVSDKVALHSPHHAKPERRQGKARRVEDARDVHGAGNTIAPARRQDGLFRAPSMEPAHHRLTAADTEAAPIAPVAMGFGLTAVMLPPQAAENELPEDEGEPEDYHAPSCIIGPRISQDAFERTNP